MATPKSQRIGIWIITIVMSIGTIGSFMVIVLSMQNASQDTSVASTYEDYLKQLEEQKQAAQDNADNSKALDGYEARKFDSSKVSSLGVETLKEGDGAEIQSTDTINVSYFGWTSDGVIFDSSTKKDTNEDTPITFALSGVITGWQEGLAGVKAGSVVRLTIPSDEAYGSTGSGIIPADAPLEFIVEIHEIIAES